MSKVRSHKISKKVAPAPDDSSSPVVNGFELTPLREAGHPRASWSSSAKRLSTETDVSRSVPSGVGAKWACHATPASTRAVLHYVVPCPCAGDMFSAAMFASIAA